LISNSPPVATGRLVSAWATAAVSAGVVEGEEAAVADNAAAKGSFFPFLVLFLYKKTGSAGLHGG